MWAGSVARDLEPCIKQLKTEHLEYEYFWKTIVLVCMEIRSTGLWQLYINIYITVLDIILVHHPVFYLKHDFSENGLCLRPKVESTLCGDRLPLSVGVNWVGSTWRQRHSPVPETFCFKYKTGRWIMSILWQLCVWKAHPKEIPCFAMLCNKVAQDVF
jgi:hypothetical protein